jgi:UDP-glucose 4-epimerase
VRRLISEKMPKALVTGGAGFIASHLVDLLLKEGYEVTVLDNLSDGNLENLVHLKNDKRFLFVEGDLRDPTTVDRLVRGVDAVFHLAAHAKMRVSLGDHRVDLEHNVIGTINLLEAMVQNNVHDLIFASTSALYGEAAIVPTPEEYIGIQTSLYGAAKLACEAYAEAYSQFAQIKFWAYRFGTVLGERCRRGAIWDFEHKLKQDPKHLEILGNGKQSKDYLYVKDCVEGIWLGYKKSSEPVNIFNLGLQEQTTVDELAGIVIEEMGLSSVERKYTGGSRGWIGDNPVVYLKVDKIKSLGWKPKMSPKETIRLTAGWTLKDIERSAHRAGKSPK